MVRVLLAAHAACSLAPGLRDELRRAGFALRLATDGDVLAAARRFLPDVALLVGPDAEAEAAEFRFDPRTAELPLLFAPAGGRPGVRAEPDGALPTPFGAADVVRAARVALDVAGRRRAEGVRADLPLTLSSDLDALDELCDRLPDWFAACGLTEYGVRQLTTAVREICANAIEWGHNYDPALPIRVHARLEDDKVSILVSDTGPGFDRYDLPHAARHGDPLSHMAVRRARNLRDGGFGLLIAGSLVDQLCFSASGNDGLLWKFLPAARRAYDGAVAS